MLNTKQFVPNSQYYTDRIVDCLYQKYYRNLNILKILTFSFGKQDEVVEICILQYIENLVAMLVSLRRDYP